MSCLSDVTSRPNAQCDKSHRDALMRLAMLVILNTSKLYQRKVRCKHEMDCASKEFFSNLSISVRLCPQVTLECEQSHSDVCPWGYNIP
ncbi:hypothetical protein J6590_087763 [Homalodisca vitripennis]|nr:hypothetical protein J6590_087763 [Homalodisca vitripennis]